MSPLRKSLLFFSLFFLTSLVCKHLNDNFDTKDLLSPCSVGAHKDFTEHNSLFPVQRILSQDFSFLGKGHQAFTFVSADGEYVLKLFKPHYPHITLFGSSCNFTYIPFAKGIYRLLFKKKFQKHIEEDVTSYINGLVLFKKESLTEYLHVDTSSHLHKKLRVFDKKEILRELDADTTCFLIQKKVTPLQQVLQTLVQEQKTDDIRIVLQKLLHLLDRRVSLGFYKPTHKFHANFGCVGLEPAQLDIGRLLTNKDLGLDASTPTQTLEGSIQKLSIWLQDRQPTLIPLLEEISSSYTRDSSCSSS